MKIKEIKDKKVRERALYYASSPEAASWRVEENLTANKYIEDMCLDLAFCWESAEEGSDYWESVYYNKTPKNKKSNSGKMCPEEPAEKEDQVNPKHYKENLFGEELQHVMVKMFGEKEYKTFCKLNAFKYRMRAGKKSDKIEQDIEKAMWYEEKLKSL